MRRMRGLIFGKALAWAQHSLSHKKKRGEGGAPGYWSWARFIPEYHRPGTGFSSAFSEPTVKMRTNASAYWHPYSLPRKFSHS